MWDSRLACDGNILNTGCNTRTNAYCNTFITFVKLTSNTQTEIEMATHNGRRALTSHTKAQTNVHTTPTDPLTKMAFLVIFNIYIYIYIYYMHILYVRVFMCVCVCFNIASICVHHYYEKLLRVTAAVA